MSLRKFVQQVRPREQSYKPKLIIVEELLAEEELPKDIMRGLSYEKSEKQSTSKRDVYIVRSSDRETDRDEILRNLNQAGIADCTTPPHLHMLLQPSQRRLPNLSTYIYRRRVAPSADGHYRKASNRCRVDDQ